MSLLETEREGVLENLPDLLAFVEQACRRVAGDDEACFSLKLATEEACVNIITHGYTEADRGPIRLAFREQDGRAVLAISDQGRSFPPEEAVAPDLAAGWDERPLGGLGLHLIRAMVDEVTYSTDPRRGNTLTLVKRLRQEQRPGKASNEPPVPK